jgi:hypothetical protein
MADIVFSGRLFRVALPRLDQMRSPLPEQVLVAPYRDRPNEWKWG